MKNQIKRGAILPLVAVVMGVLIVVLGLMVELSWLYSTQFEVQSASDLATRSALARLYANEEDLDQSVVDEAKQFGLDVFRKNFNRSEPISEDDLTFGEIKENGKFKEVNSIHDITASRVESDQEFTSILGALIAKNRVDLNFRSVAEAGRIDFVLSLDASRSMNRTSNSRRALPPGGRTIHEPPLPGSRWFALEDAVNSFFENIEDSKIQVGLTTFGGGLNHRIISPLDDSFSRIEFELDAVETNTPKILEKLDEYVDYEALGFGTSIYDGVDQAIDVLKRTSVPAKRFIILLTDGEQVAPGRPSQLEAAYRAKDENVRIFAIAYSTNARGLQQMVDITGGQVFSVSNSDELNLAFKEIASTLRTRITQ